ncbi:MAG: class I SAM-dependent methyltransferase [Bdellovibrionales bacterium]
MIDLGGGSGFVAKGLNDIGINTYLLEPNPKGARKGVKRGIPQVICARLEDCHFEANSIGGFGLFDVIEHIKNDKQYIDQLHPLLMPGGHIYITTPAYSWLWSAEDDYAQHFRRYTRPALCDLFDPNKFEIEYVTYFFQWLVIPIFLIRSIPYRLGLAKATPDFAPNIDHHARQEGESSTLFERLLSYEIKSIENKKQTRWGASLLMIAKKKAL